ncbi:hypothetical protein DL93DRAFT_2191697 [Clavulina sp. PMI_390]|nr:hypothetical protein DL93DRAFT_2191697 [Clavulina sp. PMI_390]
MAFRFDFGEDELEENEQDAARVISPGITQDAPIGTVPDEPATDPATDAFMEIPLEELIQALPPVISYTPLRLPLATAVPRNPQTNSGPSSAAEILPIVLPRRDLFDVRFQLLNADDEDAMDTEPKELESVDAPSDLVPGVYEGGLKTWECSIDLAAYLAHSVKPRIPGGNFLELGCGTALPSLYLLYEVFNNTQASSDPQATMFCLQDYNRSALELMTLPNIILTWYLSPAAGSFKAQLQTSTPLPSSDSASPGGDETDRVEAMDEDDEPDALKAPKPVEAERTDLEVELTPELLEAFQNSLRAQNIHLRFFSGSWSSFATHFNEHVAPPVLASGKKAFDLVLTSETIYRTQSLSSLLNVLHLASSSPLSSQEQSLCLVAAKVVYFGVGGGISEFIRALESGNPKLGGSDGVMGDAETVWEQNQGVARRIMRVHWKDDASETAQ